jgi:hypothetical protein
MISRKMSLRRHVIVCSAAALLAMVLSAAHAATITWSSPQQITGDSDVSTFGDLVGAFNIGAAGVPSTTVNTVVFASFPTSGGNGSSGNFSTSAGVGVFESNTAGGSATGSFTGLSPAYQTLLESYSTPLFTTMTLSISGLTVGQEYQFQWWANLSSEPFGFHITAMAGNDVTLDTNTASSEGGLGQWATGTFTADATTQAIGFLGDGDGGMINGFQLRQVPEPAVLSLLGVGASVFGLGLVRRRRTGALDIRVG